MKKKNFKYNEGVTLLIAVLILSVVMAVSFSLATVLLAESRSSGDLLRTEPALYAATSVTEEALFGVKRVTGNSSYSTLVGNTKLTSATAPFNDPIQTVKVFAGTRYFTGSQNVYLIYNPDNLHGPSNYSRLTVTFLDTHTPGTKLNIYLCQWDPQNPPTDAEGNFKEVCTDAQDTSYMSYQNSHALNPGETWDTSGIVSGSYTCGSCINPNFQQELILYQTPGSVPADISVQIESFDSDGNPKGIPYFNKTAVDVSAANANVGRNVRVVIPKNP